LIEIQEEKHGESRAFLCVTISSWVKQGFS